MKAIVILITTAIACTLASSKIVTIPFTAVERNGIRASASGRKKLGDLVDAPLKNIDLAYLIDVEIGKFKFVFLSYILKYDI